jgi:hypothetical protein
MDRLGDVLLVLTLQPPKGASRSPALSHDLLLTLAPNWYAAVVFEQIPSL